MKLKTILSVSALLFAVVSLYSQDYHFVLWDNTTAPSSNEVTGEEVVAKSGNVSNVSSAEMWIYKATGNPTGKAIVFFPGGGYSNLSMPNGHKEAQWFASHGITAAVVKYRLPNGHREIPQCDAEAAVRKMKSMADELGFSADSVGVAGTSAGGYLAATMGTLSAEKPAFMVLFYPVISADLDKRHKGTFVQLLGKEDADKPVAQNYSLEKKVSSDTPPAIIFHCDDDLVVPAINASLFYTSLKQYGIHATLHIYPSGGHGWGMSEKFKYHEHWKAAVLDWLNNL